MGGPFERRELANLLYIFGGYALDPDRRELRRLSTLEPSVGMAAFNERMRRVLDGLRLAGLPE